MGITASRLQGHHTCPGFQRLGQQGQGAHLLSPPFGLLPGPGWLPELCREAFRDLLSSHPDFPQHCKLAPLTMTTGSSTALNPFSELGNLASGLSVQEALLLPLFYRWEN